MSYRSILLLVVAAAAIACADSNDLAPTQPSTLTSSLTSADAPAQSQVPSVVGTWSGTRTTRLVNRLVFDPRVNLCELSLRINSQDGAAFFGAFVSHGIGNLSNPDCENTGTFNGFIVAGGLRFIIPFNDFGGCVGTPDGIFVGVMPSLAAISAQSSGCGTPVSFFVNRR